MDKILTIIIVNWNTKDLLLDCIRSIRKCSIFPKMYLVVVDNDSEDGSSDAVKELFHDVKIINTGGNKGFAKANNIGLNEIRTPYILFLNPDTIVEHKSIEVMVEHMIKNASIGAVGCKMLNLDGNVQELGVQWFPTPFREFIRVALITENNMKYLKWIIPYHAPQSSGFVNKLYGGCLMVRLKVLKEIGKFDERFFMYCEDVDLCRRIQDAGYQLFYTSEEKILHIGGGASERASSQFSVLMMNESISKLMHKYYGSYGKLMFKFYIFIAGSIRLFMIGSIRILNILKIKKDGNTFNDSFDKYNTMIRWSLSLKKAFIPD